MSQTRAAEAKEAQTTKPEQVDDLAIEDRENYRRARREHEQPQRRLDDSTKSPKSLEDIPPQERHKNSPARAEAKEMKKAAMKPGQGSGLNAEEKEQLI